MDVRVDGVEVVQESGKSEEFKSLEDSNAIVLSRIISRVGLSNGEAKILIEELREIQPPIQCLPSLHKIRKLETKKIVTNEYQVLKLDHIPIPKTQSNAPMVKIPGGNLVVLFKNILRLAAELLADEYIYSKSTWRFSPYDGLFVRLVEKNATRRGR